MALSGLRSLPVAFFFDRFFIVGFPFFISTCLLPPASCPLPAVLESAHCPIASAGAEWYKHIIA